MPKLSKIRALKAEYEALDPETRAAEDAKAWEGMRAASAQMHAYIEEALEGVSESEREQFDEVPINQLRRAKRLFLPRLRLDVALRARARRTTRQRPRERRVRRAARTVGSRGNPSDPDEPSDLARASRRAV